MCHITFGSDNNLRLPRARSSLYGIDTFRFIGQKLWQTLPREIKESQSLEIFFKEISSLSKRLIAAVNYVKVDELILTC